MANLSRPEASVRWKFSYDTNQGRFNDALYFTGDQYQALTVGEILEMQRVRRDAWLEALRQARINARAATKAERIAERAARQEAWQAEQEAIAALDAEIAAMPDDPV